MVIPKKRSITIFLIKKIERNHSPNLGRKKNHIDHSCETMASLANETKTPAGGGGGSGGGRKKLQRRDSYSLETAEINNIANLDISFVENIHVEAPSSTIEGLEAAKILKISILQLEKAQGADPLLIAPIITPANLQRILRARKFNQEEALELAEATVNWRVDER